MHTYTGLCMSIHMCIYIYILCMYEPQRNIRPTLYETFDGASWDMVGYGGIWWDMVGYMCIYIYSPQDVFLIHFMGFNEAN